MLEMEHRARSGPGAPTTLHMDKPEALVEMGPCGRCQMRDIGICAAQAGEELTNLSRRVRLAAKATVFEEGAQADSIWALVSGMVLLSKLLQDGRRQVVGIAVPGDLLNLSLQEMNSFTATALTPASLCRFERARFVELLERAPGLMRRVFDTCTHELNLAQNHMLLLGRRSAEEKVATFLLSLRARCAPLHGLRVFAGADSFFSSFF